MLCTLVKFLEESSLCQKSSCVKSHERDINSVNQISTMETSNRKNDPEWKSQYILKMHCMLPLNSLTVGSHHVVRHSVPIHGDSFFGLLTTTCGTHTIFVLWTFDCPGYFAFMAVYMVLTCCLWAVLKLIGRKGHAGWQLSLSNYKYIANEPLFY